MGTNRLTQGPIYSGIVKYFFPIFLGSLIQQSYSIVDAIIIGRYAGVYALASIDATHNFTRLIIHIFMSTSLGGTIIIAQSFGARLYKKLSRISHILILMSLVGGIFFTLLGLILTPVFIDIMKVPKDLIQMSKAYLSIYFFGTTSMFVYNIGAGILRALGDSKRPFYILLASSVLNVILDFILIAYFDLGVSGAAAATIIAQTISSIIIIRILRCNVIVAFSFLKIKVDLKIVKEVLKIGLPMGLQALTFVISNMMMQRAINTLGAIEVAGWAVVGKLDFVLWLIIDAAGITVTTFVAQNLGAKRLDRIRKGNSFVFFFTSIIVISFSIILLTHVQYMTRLFTSDLQVIVMTSDMIWTIGPFYIFTCIASLVSNILKGYGDTLKPMLITLITTFSVRIIWVMIFTYNIKQVLLAYPVTWTITMGTIIAYVFIQRRINIIKELKNIA